LSEFVPIFVHDLLLSNEVKTVNGFHCSASRARIWTNRTKAQPKRASVYNETPIEPTR